MESLLDEMKNAEIINIMYSARGNEKKQVCMKVYDSIHTSICLFFPRKGLQRLIGRSRFSVSLSTPLYMLYHEG